MDAPVKSETLKSIAIMGAVGSGLPDGHILGDAGNTVTVFPASRSICAAANPLHPAPIMAIDFNVSFFPGGFIAPSSVLKRKLLPLVTYVHISRQRFNLTEQPRCRYCNIYPIVQADNLSW